MIYLVNKKSKIENVKRKYPNAYIMDLTSKARDPYVRFSPFYPHGNIPVPFSDGEFSYSVEGIWQGLKVFESEDIDLSKFQTTSMLGLKRTIRTKGKILGHRKGIVGKELLGYLEARMEIYLPTYKFILEHFMFEYIEKLREAHKVKDLVFLDYDTNNIIESSKPLSHAFLVKSYLEGNYPNWDNFKKLDLENHLKSEKSNKSKPNKTDNTQSTLF